MDNARKEESRIDAAQVLLKEKVGEGKNRHDCTTHSITSLSTDPIDPGRNPGAGENGRKGEDSHHNSDVQFGTAEI
jgi:uncharacterized protein with von Willebrand factor type A (vWA) domain